MKRSILLTNDFPPVIGGISTVFYNIWRYYPHDRMLILTPLAEGSEEFDSSAYFRPIRFRTYKAGKLSKITTIMLMALRTAWYVLFCNVREIHAGHILSYGPIGYMFQKTLGIPCYLWVYGGETSSAYKLEKWIVGKLLKGCARLVTNSPEVTKEFLTYGIPKERRLIELVPAVDSDFFTPGPPPGHLIEKYNLQGKKVILTVARLVKRKGHDLVLRALNLMKDQKNLHYIIVGSGEDKGRLEEIAETLGLSDRVTFAGRVEDNELPDYYRLCDIYVMPNREVLETTDSLEGFGISFIDANACGKPSIAGRSGGTGEAVAEGVTGYIVNPENPQELAEKIRFLLDNPEIGLEMGRKGRERTVRDFSWKQRAIKLAKYITIPVEI